MMYRPIFSNQNVSSSEFKVFEALCKIYRTTGNANISQTMAASELSYSHVKACQKFDKYMTKGV